MTVHTKCGDTCAEAPHVVEEEHGPPSTSQPRSSMRAGSGRDCANATSRLAV